MSGLGARMKVGAFLLALLAAGVLFGPTLAGMAPGDDTRKITFDVEVGDGKTWAGGFTVTYSVGSAAKPPVSVLPLKTGDRRKNTWRRNVTVKVGTAVSMHVRADWAGVPIRLQLRGFGVSPRPVETMSPFEPVISDVVR